MNRSFAFAVAVLAALIFVLPAFADDEDTEMDRSAVCNLLGNCGQDMVNAARSMLEECENMMAKAEELMTRGRRIRGQGLRWQDEELTAEGETIYNEGRRMYDEAKAMSDTCRLIIERGEEIQRTSRSYRQQRREDDPPMNPGDHN